MKKNMFHKCRGIIKKMVIYHTSSARQPAQAQTQTRNHNKPYIQFA